MFEWSDGNMTCGSKDIDRILRTRRHVERGTNYTLLSIHVEGSSANQASARGKWRETFFVY